MYCRHQPITGHWSTLSQSTTVIGNFTYEICEHYPVGFIEIAHFLSQLQLIIISTLKMIR